MELVDSDLWLHPDSKVYTDQEKIDLDNFPDEEVPVWGEFGTKSYTSITIGVINELTTQ